MQYVQHAVSAQSMQLGVEAPTVHLLLDIVIVLCLGGTMGHELQAPDKNTLSMSLKPATCCCCVSIDPKA